MLSASEMADFQDLQEEAMPDLCTNVRSLLADDGAGGQRKTPSTVFAGVHCRRRSASKPKERIIADRLTGVTAETVVLPAGTSVMMGDQLTVTNWLDGSTSILKVEGVVGGTYATAVYAVCVAWTAQ